MKRRDLKHIPIDGRYHDKSSPNAVMKIPGAVIF